MTVRERQHGMAGFGAVVLAGIEAAAACAALAGAPRAAGAEPDDLPYRLERPTSIRAGPMLYLDISSMGFVVGDAGPRFDAALGVTVARQVLDRLALEGMVGGGGQGRHSGPHLGAAVRYTVLAGEEGALTLALGSHGAFLKDYGPVLFGRLEAAFQLRTWSGFDLVAGGGIAAPLNDSRAIRAHCSRSFSDTGTCPSRFRAGAVGFLGHVEAGWSF